MKLVDAGAGGLTVRRGSRTRVHDGSSGPGGTKDRCDSGGPGEPHRAGVGVARRWFRLLAGAAAATLLVAVPAASAPTGASSWFSHTWGVNGRAAIVLPVGSDVLVGGSFSALVAPSGDTEPAASLARWQPDTGRFVDWPVSVRGDVLGLAVAGDTLYLGGNFNQVNGQSRRNLAAVSLSTGALLPWAPSATGTVETVAVVNDGVYVGGAFSQIADSQGQTTVNWLARITTSGQLDRAWTGSVAVNDRVRVILPSADPGWVYVGGDFSQTNGVWATGRLTKLSTGTTAIVNAAFRSGPTNERARSPVFGLALTGDALLVASGGSGGGCARLDATTGGTVWSVHANGNLQDVAVLGPMVYCGGHFGGSSGFDGKRRTKIAEVRLDTGAVTAWAPQVNSPLGVWTVAATPTRLVMGGDFTKVGATRQPHLGEFRDLGSISPPPPPTGLNAVPGNGSVSLEWSLPDTDGGAELRSYDIMRAPAVGDYIPVGKTASLSYTDRSVTNGQTYRYAVRSVSAAQSGPLSDAVTVTPNAGLVFPPTVPVSFSVTGGSSAKLLWGEPASDGGDPITGYRVYRGVGGGAAVLLAQLGPGARSYEDSTCPTGESCAYQVSAVNGVGEGPRTVAISVVGSTGVPDRPVLAATVNGDGSVTLSWTVASSGGSPITGFVVLRDSIRIATPPGTATSYRDTGLRRGQTYTYQIRAKNAYGASKNSKAVVVTIP